MLLSVAGVAALLVIAIVGREYTGVWVARQDLRAFEILQEDDVRLDARRESDSQDYAPRVEGHLLLATLRSCS